MKYLARCNVYISDVYKVKADNEDDAFRKAIRMFVEDYGIEGIEFVTPVGVQLTEISDRCEETDEQKM